MQALHPSHTVYAGTIEDLARLAARLQPVAFYLHFVSLANDL